MLVATPPDKYDRHTHLVEVDGYGDGISDEAGDPPHTHEIAGGAVVPLTSKGYTSEHPGNLITIDDGVGTAENLEATNNEDQMVISQVESMLFEIASGGDVDDIAYRLLFE